MKSEILDYAHAAASSSARMLPRDFRDRRVIEARSIDDIADELLALVGDLPRFEAALQKVVESEAASLSGSDGMHRLFTELARRVGSDRKIVKIIKGTLHRESRRRQVEIARLDAEEKYAEQRTTAWSEYAEWLKDPTTSFSLQRAETSNRARLIEAVMDRAVYSGAPIDGDTWWVSILKAIENSSAYLIEHDWAAAFAKAGQFDAGEFALPDEVCAFEMKIDGHAILTLAHIEADHYLFMSTFVRVKTGWVIQGTFTVDLTDGKAYMWVGKTNLKATVATVMENGDLHLMPEGKSDRRIVDLVYSQIRAACIALDAEVATSTPQRAEYRRNYSREKGGRTGFSYNVVSLARKPRAERLARDPGEEPTVRRRLHFRRGHWRHYDDHKTWIKWMLVGDPELGFVDKHYRL